MLSSHHSSKTLFVTVAKDLLLPCLMDLFQFSFCFTFLATFDTFDQLFFFKTKIVMQRSLCAPTSSRAAASQSLCRASPYFSIGGIQSSVLKSLDAFIFTPFLRELIEIHIFK